MTRGELIVGRIPRGLSKRLVGRVMYDRRGLGVSYRFVGMIMTIPHGPGLNKQHSDEW